MARIAAKVVLVLSALLISSWVPISQCSKKPVGVARKEDIPFIRCQVCEKLAAQLHQQVQKKQSQISPKKVFYHLGPFFIEDLSTGFCLILLNLVVISLFACRVFGFFLGQISEYEIIEISENVCNLKKGEADWILKIDIVERGDKLEVREKRA